MKPKKLKNPSKTVAKAFIVASSLGTIINALSEVDASSTNLVVLERQCERAMNVFKIQVGIKKYTEIAESITPLWEEIITKHNIIIKEEYLPLFIDFLCHIINPKQFQDFFAIKPYRYMGNSVPSLDILVEINNTIVEYDHLLNELLGTKQYSSPFILKKPKKIKRSRSQPTSPNNITDNKNNPSRKKLLFAEKRKKKQAFFASIREKAERARKEEQ